ncbi:type IA DNA topoisomerase [Pseudomonas putida]|uniref:Type IA DNA topoisomerase n=1 Tax=Pseudomonas putida TaxID=303 RepID=A0A8I1ECE4_PSEPU|nr:type IA DNA topoisomerase [Pseudomonas putida]MBI6882708.1 type IA DNA topoisomerase [Pseudomonas putida]
MRLIVTEKPNMTKLLAPYVAERWPGEELVVICSMPYLLNAYSYPRGLSYSTYPLLGEPAYKNAFADRFDDGSFTTGLIINPNGAMKPCRLTLEQASQEMRRADQIVFAGDWDHAGVWGMERMLDLLAPEHDKSAFEVAVINGGLDETSLRRVLSSLITPTNPRYLALKNAAQVKRYFDYNFNVNSLAILGNLYRSVTGTNQPVLITKNMVQILIRAAEHGEVIESGRGYSLQNWQGTGKYNAAECRSYEWWFEGMGSAASRPAILKQMSSLGLIKSESGTQWPNRHLITPLGLELRARLHKGCTDPDLPFRLCHWMAKPFEEARKSIDAYLLEFFRKQKRLHDNSKI